jgi:hypothetical protein
MNRLVIPTLCAAAFMSASASAADAPTTEDFQGRLGLEVPQSAGFALLGVTPDKVIDPQGGRDLSLALLQGLDENGNFQAGFALETRPFLWNRAEYIEEPTRTERFLAGFKISFATTTGVEDQDKADRYGLGINWTYQFNDPLFNGAYLACSKAAYNAAPAIPGGPAETEADIRQKVKACGTTHLGWATSAIGAGAAAQRGKDDEQDLSENGFGLWLTGSLALRKNLEWVAHLRHVDNQLSVVEDVLQETDTTVMGSRVRFGGSKVRGILEASWNDFESGSKKDDYTLVSVGGEFKVAGSVWFRIAYGDTLGSDADKKEFFNGQLRYGFGATPVSSYD